MFESYYEGLVWIIIKDISWILVLLLGTLLTNLVKRFQFFFFSFVYYVFVAKIWFSAGHYNLWKFNALFVYKNFQYYSITWMLFSYQVVLLLLWTNSHGPILWSGLQLRYTINKSCVWKISIIFFFFSFAYYVLVGLLSWANKYVDTTLLLLLRIQLITR